MTKKELENEIERLEKLVQHHDENGWTDTVFHDELKRLRLGSQVAAKGQDEKAGPPDKSNDESLIGKGSATKSQ